MKQLTRGGRGAPTAPPPVLPVVAVGVLLAALDLFIVNVALPDIAADLSVPGLSELSWIVNGYTIAFAALLVPAGGLGDRYGNKPVFLTGMTVFVAGSALCAAAPDLALLVAFRVLQAAGAALMVPTSLALVLTATPAERRAGAVRLWVALSGLGAALGPVAGALLAEASWRWVFLVNVPLGLAAVAVGVRVLPNPPGDRGRVPDPVGALLLTGAVSFLVTALVEGQHWGWSARPTLGFGAAALVCAALLCLSVLRSPAPIVDRAVLGAPNFSLMAANTVLFNAAFGAMLLSSVLWLQQVWQWEVLWAGLALAPGPLLVPPVSVLSGRLAARIGPGPVIAAGSVLFAAGVCWWALFARPEPDYVGGVLVGMLLTGAGVGLCLPSALATATAGLPRQHSATGSSVLNTSRQIGLALGVAVLVAVLGGEHAVRPESEAFRAGWWIIAGLALASGCVALGVRRPAATETEGVRT
ncbi:MFS transporter [Nocardiopsis sp. LOL_012]|uniref:MFS transporter n=1 Tax=Nocardiopsis sp. LOL_012 TaxID=3345409 RepID=UPI003A887FB9